MFCLFLGNWINESGISYAQCRENGASDPNALNETYTLDPWGNQQQSDSFKFIQQSPGFEYQRTSRSA